MKSLKYRLKKHEVNLANTDWNKYDERLMKAVERGEVDKVSAVLQKKVIIPTKLDLEGRSAFHLAATRGHLDCLNLILGHTVDITATDATGKNALHLAARNGHSLCVQKLLQHNCPIGNVDLQGRTALHDAVMAGCPSSVKLLCESGAAVNAKDFDGRTPLVLATQMCHPRICQLLLERGADITIRDKQDKTALILGCEFGCKDAVEVLVKSGADLRPQDVFGHDAFHYARHSKSPELLTLLRGQQDKAREKDARIEQWKRQHSVERPDSAEIHRRDQIIHELERQNEDLQETLQRSQHEQRGLLDQVSQLQQQLTQEKVDECLKEMDSPKVSREDGARGQETVKVQLKSPMGDYSGQSVIKGKENVMKTSQSLDTQTVQRVSMSRSGSRGPSKGPSSGPSSGPSCGWDIPAELELMQRELEQMRRRQVAAEEENARLQAQLGRRSRELQELEQSRDSAQRQADAQVQALEDALGDVQKRMLESECKVKQLQAHVVAVKEHLGGQANEDLRAQLQDVKAKYEGASAEVCRLRNRLKQSEKALEEYKSSESQLASESERLSGELGSVSAERDVLGVALRRLEQQLNETHAKHTVPAEKFDNMKNLLTNAVDEKERQIAELREDYDRVLEEVADLHRRTDTPTAHAAAPDQSTLQLEELNTSLKRRLQEVTAKSQALIQEVEESEEERDLLREQLENLNSTMETDFIPVQLHEEARRNMVQALEELEDKLVEASERYSRAEAQAQRLQSDKSLLQEELQHLHSSAHTMDHLTQLNTDLLKQVETMERRCKEKDEECLQLNTQRRELQKRLEGDYVPKEKLDQLKTVNADLFKQVDSMQRRCKEKESECVQLNTQRLQLQKSLDGDYVSREKVQQLTELNADLVKQVETMQRKCEEKDSVCSRLNTQKSELEKRLGKDFLPRDEVETLKTLNADLVKEVETMQRRCKDRDAECVQLNMQRVELQKRLEGDHVPKAELDRIQKELTTTIHDLRVQLETRKKEHSEELRNVKEGNDKLKGEMEKLRLEMRKDYVSASEHNTATDRLKAAAVEAENRANKASEMYAEAKDETSRLTRELEAQRQELDTIQDAIQSKFVPKTVVEEKERSYETRLKEVSEKLKEMEEEYNKEKSRRENTEQERERLTAQSQVLDQRLDQALVQRKTELEKEYCGKFTELQTKVQDLEKQREEVDQRNTELQRENANYSTQVESLQERLRSELARISNYDSELQALNEEVRQSQADCEKARVAQRDQSQKISVLQRELQESREENQHSATNSQSLEAQVQKLTLALKEEEENNSQRAEDVSTLQTELLQATQALDQHRTRHDDLSQLQKDKQQLSVEAVGLREKLMLLSEEVQDAREDAARVSGLERRARLELSSLQEKSLTVEGEVGELKERYDKSLSTIQDLQRSIQASAQQTQTKDKKISELLSDAEHLKQALNGLSQLAYSSSAPKRHSEALQAQIKNLQQQLADAERQHREVVSIYRTHLLSAAQGHMDEDVQAALLQIIRMRQEFVC